MFAAGLCFTFVLLYGLLYVLWQPGSDGASPVPALVYLLIVVTLWTWLLAGVAFALDRHRLPTLLSVALISVCLDRFEIGSLFLSA